MSDDMELDDPTTWEGGGARCACECGCGVVLTRENFIPRLIYEPREAWESPPEVSIAVIVCVNCCTGQHPAPSTPEEPT